MTLMITFAVLIGGCVAGVIFLVKYLIFLWRLRSIPTIPGGVPVFGHLLMIWRFQRERDISVTEAVYAVGRMGFDNPDFRKKGIFKFYLGPMPFVVVVSPEIIQTLLQEHNLPKSFIYHTMNLATEGLVNMQTSERWKRHRKLLTPAFHFEILEGLSPIIHSQTKRMIDELEESLGCNDDGSRVIKSIEPFVARNTFRILCESSMGSKLEHLSDSYFDETVHAYNEMEGFLVDRMFLPWMMIDSLLPFYERGRRCQKLVKDVLSFASMIFEEGRKSFLANWNPISDQEEVQKKPSFIDILFREIMSPSSSHPFTSKDAWDEFTIFLAAGFDTTTMALTWALYLIGHYPQIQERIQEELDDVLGESEEVTMSALRKLIYLDAVIRESMRVMPSVPAFSRSTHRDIKVGEDILIPNNTVLAIMPLFTHRLEEYWPNAGEFDPERFLNQRGGRHPFSYLPFSAGPRNCIGSKYAIAEMKGVLSVILQNYRITSLNPLGTIRTDIQITLKPRDPISIRFERRT